jgi:hypothetical protein
MIDIEFVKEGSGMLAVIRDFALILVFILFGVEVKRFVSYLKKKIWHWPVKREAEQNREIYTELVALRAVTEADRVYVERFHNGTEFLPSHPAWKTSRTHEVVRKGVTYESGNRQNLLVSLIPHLIDPILTGGSTAVGVRVPECNDCLSKMRCIAENKRVVIVQVEDMENSYCKYHLESQNIKTMIYCGTAYNGNVCGMVGADFCGKRLSDMEALIVAKKICAVTEKIHYSLQYKKQPKDCSPTECGINVVE